MFLFPSHSPLLSCHGWICRGSGRCRGGRRVLSCWCADRASMRSTDTILVVLGKVLRQKKNLRPEVQSLIVKKCVSRGSAPLGSCGCVAGASSRFLVEDKGERTIERGTMLSVCAPRYGANTLSCCSVFLCFFPSLLAAWPGCRWAWFRMMDDVTFERGFTDNS